MTGCPRARAAKRHREHSRRRLTLRTDPQVSRVNQAGGTVNSSCRQPRKACGTKRDQLGARGRSPNLIRGCRYTSAPDDISRYKAAGGPPFGRPTRNRRQRQTVLIRKRSGRCFEGTGGPNRASFRRGHNSADRSGVLCIVVARTNGLRGDGPWTPEDQRSLSRPAKAGGNNRVVSRCTRRREANAANTSRSIQAG